MKQPLQQGYSTLAMVMVLLLLGMLMLGALHHQLTTSVRFSFGERVYLQAYNQAASALSWGKVQSWSRPSIDWQCQQEQTEGLTACLRLIDNNNLALLKAQGKQHGRQQGVWLYHRVVIKQVAASEQYRVTPQPQGWLDFCPERQEVVCK